MKSLLILFVVGFVVVDASLSSLNTFERGQAKTDQKWLQSMMSKPRATHDSHGKRILYMDGQEDFFYGWVFDDEKFSSEELSHEECKLKTLSFSTVSMKQADCEDLKCPQLEGSPTPSPPILNVLLLRFSKSPSSLQLLNSTPSVYSTPIFRPP